MLKGIMYSTLTSDFSDREAEAKVKGFAGAGMRFFSTVLHINRPLSGDCGCLLPWKNVSGGRTHLDSTFDYARWENRWWDWLGRVLDRCKRYGVTLQLDLWNDCQARHSERYFGSRNVNGISVSFPRAVRVKPQEGSGWKQVVDAYYEKLIPYINHDACGAVLVSLEGGGTGFELYGFWELDQLGMRKDRILVSNVKRVADAHPRIIYSPHVHSLTALKKAKRLYVSDDGKYDFSVNLMKQFVQTADSIGCPAYESALNHLLTGYLPLDGNGNCRIPLNKRKESILPYERRVRPTLHQIVNGEMGRLVRAMR